MIDEALEFASKAHEGQFRKGTKRPYIVHPVEVADIVAAMTKDEEVISAAVLHDTIEDCQDVTEEILERTFGKHVASLVVQESEDKSKTWEERKGATIRRLKSAPKEVQMIALADKLS
ncbi:HD domain-containing protein, partial [Muricomes intestini]